MITVKEATEITGSNPLKLLVEYIPLKDSQNRILAENVSADRDYPPFNRATMDGYALSFENFKNNSASLFNVQQTIYAGDNSNIHVNKDSCVKIMTGASVPANSDMVIKVEDSQSNDKAVKFSGDNFKQWMNIAKQGEDIKAEDLLIEKGVRIDHIVLSMLATVGKVSVPVFALPKTAIITTGSEIIEPAQNPGPFQIRDSNSYTLTGLLNQYAITPHLNTRTADDANELEEKIKTALDTCDLIFVSGGVSMGEKDLTASILKSLGVEEIFHKVKIKPGKPAWFGKYKNEKFVFGMPGNPFSCQVIFKILVEPLLNSSFSLPAAKWYKFSLKTGRTKKGDRDEYFPAYLDSSSRLVAVENKGSGDIKAAKMSEGLALHNGEISELKENDLVDFIFWRN